MLALLARLNLCNDSSFFKINQSHLLILLLLIIFINLRSPGPLQTANIHTGGPILRLLTIIQPNAQSLDLIRLIKSNFLSVIFFGSLDNCEVGRNWIVLNGPVILYYPLTFRQILQLTQPKLVVFLLFLAKRLCPLQFSSLVTFRGLPHLIHRH